MTVVFLPLFFYEEKIVLLKVLFNILNEHLIQLNSMFIWSLFLNLSKSLIIDNLFFPYIVLEKAICINKFRKFVLSINLLAVVEY